MAAGGDADANLLGQHVEALVLAKDYAKALTEVRAARVRFPDDPELAALEANVLRTRGDVDAAVASVEKLRKKAPDDVNVLVAGRRLLPAGQAVRGRGGARCARRARSSPGTCARSSSSGPCSSG